MVILQIVAVVLAVIMLARAANLILLMRWYAKPPSPGKIVYVNNKRVFYTAKGSGSPTVVIEAGLGSASAEWWAVQDQLAESVSVLTYDRAGYGWSELAHGPRTSRQIAQELKSILESLKIDPPYVLVGHSLGALYVHHFCRLFPGFVAGVVLIDPLSTEDMRFKQELPPRVYQRCGVDKSPFLKLQGWLSGFGFMRLLKPILLKSPQFAMFRSLRSNELRASWNNLLAPKTAQTALNEYVQIHDPRNVVDVRNAGDFPQVPLRVLVHNSPKMRDSIMRQGDLSRNDADLVENLWQELMRAHSTLSPLGFIVETESASHSIHLTQPDIVIQTILEVVRQASKP